MGKMKKGIAFLIDSYTLYNNIQKNKNHWLYGPVVEAFTDPKL